MNIFNMDIIHVQKILKLMNTKSHDKETSNISIKICKKSVSIMINIIQIYDQYAIQFPNEFKNNVSL